MKKSTVNAPNKMSSYVGRMISYLSLALCIFITPPNVLFGQSPQFNEVFDQPLLLNPAYTGTIHSSRLIMNTRRKWSGFSSGRVAQYDTYSVSYDQFFPHQKFSIGALVHHDRAGEASLQSNTVGILGAYEIVALKGDIRIRFGLQADYSMMGIDFSGLIFEDQIRSQGTSSQEILIGNEGKVNYFDFSFGSLISAKNYWAGFAFHHLNQPNISLIDQKTTLPTKITVHGGTRIPLNVAKTGSTKKELRIGTVYQRFGNADLISLGIDFQYKMGKTTGSQAWKPDSPKINSQGGKGQKIKVNSVFTGLWYNGMSFSESFSVNYRKVDPLVFNLGFSFYHFAISSIGYSYTFPVFSELDTSTGGSHALSIRFQFGQPIECPNYYKWSDRESFPIMDAR